MFEYEHTSKFNVSAETREALVKEIEGDEFHLSPIQGKILLNDIEPVLVSHLGKSLDEIKSEFLRISPDIDDLIIDSMFKDLKEFICTDPRIPELDKEYKKTVRLKITNLNSREEIIEEVVSKASGSELSQLALYIYRQMDLIDWLPFIKAAIERNPVCFTDLNGKDITEVHRLLSEMNNESIYDGQRLALPDEVWNFRRGDGVEKSLLLATFLVHRDKSAEIRIAINDHEVVLTFSGKDYYFNSLKNFRKSIVLKGNIYQIS
jgi:hypothetical protein